MTTVRHQRYSAATHCSASEPITEEWMEREQTRLRGCGCEIGSTIGEGAGMPAGLKQGNQSLIVRIPETLTMHFPSDLPSVLKLMHLKYTKLDRHYV